VGEIQIRFECLHIEIGHVVPRSQSVQFYES
jgi:hypothetical protein